MLRLSKKVEYGLIAAQYLASKSDEMVSAKEIAEDLGLSFDFMSKTLQSMLRSGVLASQQGTKGGYKLAKNPQEISLADIIYSLNEKSSLVECLNENNEVCAIYDNCSLRSPIIVLQKKIDELFESTSVNELVTEGNRNNKQVKISMEKVYNG
jgi:Rrf2 family protein